MNILVQGTKEFVDYHIFYRGMGVALSDIGNDKYFNVYSAGPVNINNFTAEFCNKIENSMRSRGIKVRFYRIPALEAKDAINSFDWFGFFCNHGERLSPLFIAAQATDIETAIFRY